MWLVATCHVMSCDVIFLCCVMSQGGNAMSCDVLSCDELSSVVLCNWMEYVMSL